MKNSNSENYLKDGFIVNKIEQLDKFNYLNNSLKRNVKVFFKYKKKLI